MFAVYVCGSLGVVIRFEICVLLFCYVRGYCWVVVIVWLFTGWLVGFDSVASCFIVLLCFMLSWFILVYLIVCLLVDVLLFAGVFVKGQCLFSVGIVLWAWLFTGFGLFWLFVMMIDVLLFEFGCFVVFDFVYLLFDFVLWVYLYCLFVVFCLNWTVRIGDLRMYWCGYLVLRWLLFVWRMFVASGFSLCLTVACLVGLLIVLLYVLIRLCGGYVCLNKLRLLCLFDLLLCWYVSDWLDNSVVWFFHF